MKTFVILKIPFDKCIVDKTRRGASEAPDVIQKQTELNNVCWIDVEVSDDFEETQDNVTKTALKEYEKGNVVVGVGGDHSVSYGLMKAFSQKFKNAGLIVFDAHMDCESDMSPPDHEDILRAIVKEKMFKQIYLAGVRNYTKEQQQFAIKNLNWDAAEVSIDAVKRHMIEEVLSDVDNVYISIDIDVFDPEFAPGTGYTEEKGLMPKYVLPVLKMLVDSGKVRGFDICEVCPQKDVDGKTIKLAKEILTNMIM